MSENYHGIWNPDLRPACSLLHQLVLKRWSVLRLVINPVCSICRWMALNAADLEKTLFVNNIVERMSTQKPGALLSQWTHPIVGMRLLRVDTHNTTIWKPICCSMSCRKYVNYILDWINFKVVNSICSSCIGQDSLWGMEAFCHRQK